MVKRKSPSEFGIRRIILDVMKPHSPSIVDVAKELVKIKGVEGVNCVLGEMDQETENLKVIIEGVNIDFNGIEHAIMTIDGVIHSVDGVVTGIKIVEDIDTPQD